MPYPARFATKKCPAPAARSRGRRSIAGEHARRSADLDQDIARRGAIEMRDTRAAATVHGCDPARVQARGR